MAKPLLIWLLLQSVLSLGCVREEHGETEPLYFTGVIDSIKVFPAKRDLRGDFMFSPIKGQDKIWTLSYASPLELDLHTGTWTSLSENYHPRLSKPFLAEHIWKDSLTNEVFICNTNEGFIHFTQNNSRVNFYPLRQVLSVLNSEDIILAGTSNGLYTIDKRDERILKVPGFSMDVWVKDIQALNADTLMINNGGPLFPYKLKNPAKMIHYANSPGWVYNNPFIERLPREDDASTYRLHYDGKIPFMYSGSRLFFQDSTKTTYEIKNRPPGHLYHLKTDRSYIYLLYDDAFVILNKKVAMRQAAFFNINIYENIRARIFKETYSLSEYSLDTFLMRYHQIKEDSLMMSSVEFNQHLEEAVSGYFTHSLQDSRISELESAVQKQSLPPNLEKYAIVGLCIKYVRKGELEKVPAFNDLLNERYPEFEFYGCKSVLKCVIKVNHSIDSLKKLNLDEDEYLFEEARLKENLVHCGWSGDSYYDYTIVSTNYDLILKKYPHGRYADNAAFYFISMMQYGNEGDEYSKEQITACDKFLIKYPDSELVPNARLRIARNYHAYNGEPDSMMLMMDIALAELLKIDRNEISDTNRLKAIVELESSIITQKGDLIFDLKLYPEQEEYRAGEDIKLEIVLRNKTSVVRQIRLYANGSGWLVFVGPEQAIFISKGSLPDTTTQLVSVMPNETLYQVINISREARHWNSTEIGRFEFSQTGRYYLSLRDPAQRVHSNQHSIYVYK